ncbi:MAG: sn-glycerol-3-phosphate ABC transporter ATP-binding protein UgpC [Salinarimonadaceae bacterium]|nr:MAG: sn-glycerol-3-phosphate ABC transporter ATP-binding protein UgpC [Salinarimonadaceae bacterium]
MSDLKIDRINKAYGDFKALIDISLDVQNGEFVVLVGPSGCGKSTLLRSIAGLERISSGDIVLGGRSLKNVATRDRNVAMVFQSYALFPHLTVAENIGFGMKIRKRGRPEIEETVTKAAKLLGLHELVGRYPRELSGGQRQRVAMGRAIVRDPEVFLFDEPLSNLDAKLRVQMRTEIKALRQRLGITSIYVTHDQEEAMTLADRIVVMNEGQIEQIGTPLDLYDRPVNLFVAGFMGSPPMNFIPCQRVGDSLSAAGAAIAPSSLPSHLPEKLVLGIRPEALVFDSEGALEGTVEVIEQQGPHTLVIVRLDDGTMVYAQAHKHIRLRFGDAVQLGFDWSDAHLFDGVSGLRIELNKDGR